MEYHTDYIPKADYDWSMNDLETRIIELEAWLDNVRSNMCACGNHHIHPGQTVWADCNGLLCASCMVKRASRLEGKLYAWMAFVFVPGN